MPIEPKQVISNKMVMGRHGNALTPADYEKKATVDLTIRDVLVKVDGKEKEYICTTSATFLEPQESAYLVSEEIIHVPNGYVAYVFLKNRLSQRGLLAFNTGIIDAGYHGPISTLVTNLAQFNMSIPIRKTLEDGSQGVEDRAFFRVVFHRISKDPVSNVKFSNIFTLEKYKGKTPLQRHNIAYNCYKIDREKELMNLPKSFFDPDRIKNQVNSELTEKISEFSLMKLGVGITVLGVIFTMLPLAKLKLIDVFFTPEREVNSSKIEVLENRIQKLETLMMKPINSNN